MKEVYPQEDPALLQRHWMDSLQDLKTYLRVQEEQQAQDTPQGQELCPQPVDFLREVEQTTKRAT